MPRKLGADTPFDEHEDDIIYTRSALRADPDAADLVPGTDGWLGRVDAGRAADRAARVAEGEASAARSVTNGRLDDTGRALGRELGAALSGDKKSARWKRIFGGPVDDFISQAFGSQVRAMKAWLSITGDAVLEKFRADVERWTAAGDAALTATANSAQVRGAGLIAREQLAEDLTRERDGLHAQLVARANERGLARDWPARFFRVAHRRPQPTEPTIPTPPST